MTNRQSVINIEDAETEDWDTEAIQTYYAIQQFSNACDYSNVKSVQKLFSKYSILKKLQTNNVNELKQQSEWKTFKTKILEQILNEAYQKHESINERLFFAAARFEKNLLEEILQEIKRQHPKYFREVINQTKNTDSVIVFSLKYGDLSKPFFLDCMEMLINEGVDTNKFDIKGKTAIDYVTLAYIKHKETVRESLKRLAELLVQRRIYEEIDDRTKNVLEKDMRLNLDRENYITMDNGAKLFLHIIRNNTKDFCTFPKIEEYLRIENGEHTLLQFASKISDNRLPIVQFLLKNKADPNLCTENDRRTPLELAAYANNQKVFVELLDHSDTKIHQQQYNYLIRVCRPKLAQLLLESKKLDPSFTYDRTGNSPLHYAVLSSYQKATELLLKRGASLVKKNDEGKSPLAIISLEDLETYYDSCLVQDNYAHSLLNSKYKMQFNFFKSIVDPNVRDELYIIYKIMKKKNLNPLLKHPLVQAFMYLKWYRMKNYFWTVLLLQAFLFLAIGCSLNSSPTGVSPFECFFFIVNACVKLPVFFTFKRKLDFFVLKEAKAHAAVEISVILTHIFGFFFLQFRAFIFTEMAVCFLLTAGYHPRLSKWSLMLQRVFKTFNMLLIFFSLVVFTYSLGFHLLFHKQEEEEHMFRNFFTAVFKTYIMMTGEFDVEAIKFEGVAGYLLFLIFTLSISLVIVNFWTGVAVTDIENIQKHSEINACKNVLIFMKFVDYIYINRWFRVLRRFFPKPFLFLHLDEDNTVYQEVKKCRVDFFINRNHKQFGDVEDFPSRLDEDCLEKVKQFCYETKNSKEEQNIQTRLKMLDDILKNEREILFKLKEMEQILKIANGVKSKQGQTPTGSLKNSKEKKK